MKIYTKTGDKGTTALFGGDRVPKHAPRITAYGTVDETNSVVGVARSHLREATGFETLQPLLERVQQELFVLGADLATPTEAKPVVPRISDRDIEQLEADIDQLENDLPELKNFILPTGTPGAAALHQARTVCRRAERYAVLASDSVNLNGRALVYLNRLSDLLFVMARWANHQADQPEATWKPGKDASSSNG